MGEPKTRRRLWILLAVVVLAMLIPMRTQYKDGGTVRYRALLYTVTQEHQIATEQHRRGVYTGTRVQILAFEVYNNVTFVPDDIEHTLSPASQELLTEYETERE